MQLPANLIKVSSLLFKNFFVQFFKVGICGKTLNKNLLRTRTNRSKSSAKLAIFQFLSFVFIKS